jgi:glucoamylase
LTNWFVNLRWDLWWPPVWGGSYWTASLQYRALRGGARLGRAVGRAADSDVAEYDRQAAMVLDYMQVSNEQVSPSYLLN